MHLFITRLTENREEEKLPFRAFERSLTLITASYSSLQEKPINSKSYFRSYHEVDDDEKRGCESKEQPSAAASQPFSPSLRLSPAPDPDQQSTHN